MPARATPDLAVPAGNQPVAVVLILWTHADPLGAFWEGVGRQGGMKPGGRGIFAIGTNMLVHRAQPPLAYDSTGMLELVYLI